ncbi:hypothetical protein HY745_02335 [Candidatus Desantisbacteria bacterium]|nr:hypothetical protein [Candidatus Desantisbacteria bacterium]
MLEEQAKIQLEIKKNEEEKRKKDEKLQLLEERQIMEERRKKLEIEQKHKEDDEKLRQEEEEKKELAKKKENEKKISVQAKMQGAIISKEIICKKVFREPEINGHAENAIWDNTSSFAVVVRNIKGLEKSLAIKSVYTTNYIYFYIQWEDYTENVTHKTWLWDKNTKQYITGDDIEDKLNLMFAIKNNFSACMLTGLDYQADLWEWAAAKTNPSGFADDQKITISTKPIKRANSFKSNNGRKVWIKNDFDPGSASYEQNIIIDYKWDKVPRYIPKNPTGSRADIKAKGVWKDSIWMLEMRRKLLTDDKENDVQFNTNKKYPFAIAIYDHEELNNHYTSDELLLIFVQ